MCSAFTEWFSKDPGSFCGRKEGKRECWNFEPVSPGYTGPMLSVVVLLFWF